MAGTHSEVLLNDTDSDIENFAKSIEYRAVIGENPAVVKNAGKF